MQNAVVLKAHRIMMYTLHTLKDEALVESIILWKGGHWDQEKYVLIKELSSFWGAEV